jgi:hypothetical protein
LQHKNHMADSARPFFRKIAKKLAFCSRYALRLSYLLMFAGRDAKCFKWIHRNFFPNYQVQRFILFRRKLGKTLETN